MYQPDPWLPNNTAWVPALTGQLGMEQQHHSHTVLGNYLYVVAFKHLTKRQTDIVLLASFVDEELATLAEEFVQDFLIRLTVNQYARLHSYQGKGSFQKWAAVGLKRVIDKDLKKKSWHNRERLPDEEQEQLAPQQLSEIERLSTQLSLEHCLAKLSERERLIFFRRVDQEESAQTVANEFGISANAINILLSRIKNKLRRCLEEQGILSSAEL